MRINWIVASGSTFDPTIDIDKIKAVGPMWGSWKTWRACQTDNVICHDLAKCRELLARAFQAVCNFYVPKKFYQDLNRPLGVKLYEGDFLEEVDDIEDIVAGHIAASASEIVLMFGYDLSKPEGINDIMAQHRIKNRHGLVLGMIRNSPEVQWVAVDHTKSLDVSYLELPNLTCDTMENALNLLV